MGARLQRSSIPVWIQTSCARKRPHYRNFTIAALDWNFNKATCPRCVVCCCCATPRPSAPSRASATATASSRHGAAPTPRSSAHTWSATASFPTSFSYPRQRGRWKPGRSSLLALPRSPGSLRTNASTTLARKRSLASFARRAGARTLLVVGHNPGLQDLAGQLIASGDVEARECVTEKLPTSGLVVIDFRFDDWSHLHANGGRLDRFVSPRLIAEATD